MNPIDADVCINTETEEFVILEEEGDEILEIDAFTGGEIHSEDFENFEEITSIFIPIDEYYLRDPVGALEDFISDAISASESHVQSGVLNEYHPEMLRFALKSVVIEEDGEAEWLTSS